MVGFTIALVFSFWILDIRIPSCLWDKEPFTVGSVEEKRPGEYEIHYVAKMWSFDPPLVEVPMGSVLHIYLASLDVNHGFQILNTNVNLMAVPGVVNYAKIRVTDVGDYPVVCHEYCGAGHEKMAGILRVRPAGFQYADTLRKAESAKLTTVAVAVDPAVKQLLASKGCVACHSDNGSSGVGPTFKGLFGRKETLADGSSVEVDDAYLRESIRNPNAKLVKGFQPVMPPLPLTEAEVDLIVNYIKANK